VEQRKNEKIIAKREDGFFVAYAKWRDFPKLMKLVDELSEESKKFYHPWMFKSNPDLLSLLSVIGKIIKTVYPFGYAVILNCVSDKNELVGIISIYNFKKLSNNTFSVTHADVIKDKYQNMGLGSFQRATMDKIASKENIGKIWMRIHVVNEKSLSWFLKNGYRIIKEEKNCDEYNNKRYDMVELLKDFRL